MIDTSNVSVESLTALSTALDDLLLSTSQYLPLNDLESKQLKALNDLCVSKVSEVKSYINNLSSTIPKTCPEQQYSFIRSLKDTLFGKIRLGKCNTTGKLVAIKLSRLDLMNGGTSVSGKKILENPRDECQFLTELANPGHPNLVNLLNTTSCSEYHWSILEFASGGELFQRIKDNGLLCEGDCQRLFYQMLSGLAYMHSKYIAHMDVSLENLLLDDAGNIKLCDLGLAKRFSPNQHIYSSERGGKLGYMAPEVFNSQPYYPPLCDVYSAGIVLFIMLVGFPPYDLPGSSDKRFILIFSGQLHQLLVRWGFSHLVSDSAIDILNHMICPAEKRWNIDQLAQHPFLRTILQQAEYKRAIGPYS